MAPHSTAMKHVALPSRATPSSAMGAHKWSHAIAKASPRKISIVHVLAPEVIKTDVRHFRELVQRLTGKPESSNGGGASSSESTEPRVSSSGTARDEVPVAAAEGGASATIDAEVKEVGGFVHALGEENSNDAFFQGLDFEDVFFPALAMDGFSF